MGVKLDWDIEAEKGKKKEYREDKEQRGTRYRAVFRLFLTVAIFSCILGGGVYLVFQRIEQVNLQIEQLLSDTVQTEVAALRVGDLTAFEDRQRSATEDWLITQREVYNAYQTLKVDSSIVLSGRILDVEVDGQRGRVQVEEIIDGVPYVQTWFYWRYEEGWYHVPPDYTFLGNADAIESDDYIIRYHEIDAEIASQLDQSLQNWLTDACTIVDCNTIPMITVDIVAAPGASVRPADNEQNAWQFILPSPYTGRARADMPFDTNLQIDMASLLAERLVSQATNGLEPVFASDASYLRETTIAWMVGRFVQLNPETHFMQSLSENYDLSVITSLLRNLQATSGISIVSTVTGNASLADMPLDWRDYVLWRLELEDDLIEAGSESIWVSLYDFTNPDVRDSAYQRYLNNFIASNRSVLSASTVTSDTGTQQLIARVNVTRGFESGEEIIVFNLINGNWLRAN